MDQGAIAVLDVLGFNGIWSKNPNTAGLLQSMHSEWTSAAFLTQHPYRRNASRSANEKVDGLAWLAFAREFLGRRDLDAWRGAGKGRARRKRAGDQSRMTAPEALEQEYK